jgi:threonine/homoserine/homoserine lactone efflux protein
VPDLTTFSLFLIAALALLLTPSPAVLYILARSLNHTLSAACGGGGAQGGRLAGLVSALGLGIGNLILVLGLLFSALGIVTDGTYALLAGTARPYLNGNRKLQRAQNVVTGGVYIGLGLATALANVDRE